MKAIRCEALSRRYGTVLALDRLSLEVGEGAVYGFLGPNGAGKTTTLRLLSGLARPTSGRAWIQDHEVSRHPDRARRILGYLPEQPAFYPWMTAGETIRYAGRLQGLAPSDCKERTLDLLERMDLAKVRNRRVGTFSRGMKQRLGLAAALLHRPPLLLLDEPASALDPAGRKEVLDLIDQLRGGATIFMSTHILADVERVCDTVGIIDGGRLIIESDRRELQDKFARPVFEIEFERMDPSSPGQAGIESLVQTLGGMPWVDRVQRKDQTLRVEAADLDQAKRGLFRRAAESGMAVVRFEIKKPGLEEVFLRLTGGRASP